MANRRMEFLIGMTVLVVFATIIIMTILFGSNKNLFQFNKQAQKLSITFDKAPGIKNTSRVTKSGIEIGRVYRTELIDSEKGTNVRVYFTLNRPDTKIYTNEQARIKPSLLMGEAEIEFVKNWKFEGDVHEVTPNDDIAGISGSDIMGTVNNIEGDLKDAIQSVNATAQEAAQFIANLNNFMGSEAEIQMKKEKLASIFDELGGTLKITKSLAANMDSILSNPQIRENIQRGAADFPNILNKVDSLLNNGEDLYKSVKGVVERSHNTFDKLDRSLDNVGDFTDVLSDEGLEFISNMNASGQDIARMVKNISSLSENIVKQIDNKSTPLGMLTDEKVGDQIRGIVRNVETGTEKIQPILDDARVFTNKIAHRPSSLIFSRDTYKGSPSLAQNSYNYQPYSPGGGMTSSLWTQTHSYNAGANSGQSQYDAAYAYGNGTGYEYYPSTMESMAASHPETYNALQREKCCFKSGIGNGLGKSCFGKLLQKNDDNAAPGYVTDMGEYYGYGSMVSDDSVMYNEEMAYGGAYLPGAMPVSDENLMTVPQERQCGLRAMHFSLTSAFKNIFKHGDTGAELQHKSCLNRGGNENAVYGVYTGDQAEYSEGWIPAAAASYAPAYGSLYESENNLISGENCSIQNCEVSGCTVPECGSLGGGDTSPLPGGMTGLSSLPPVTGASIEEEVMELDDVSGTYPSTLPPGMEPQKKENLQNSEPEVLPPEALRKNDSQTSYKPSGMSPGYSNAAAPTILPEPKKSKVRSFVDDGLPIQFTPNE